MGDRSLARGVREVPDVTGVKAAERQAQMLAAVVEASDDAIVSTTLDGVVQTWNPGAERLYGYSSAEAVGASLADLIVPEHLRGQEHEADREGFETGQIERYETERRRKDGSRVHVSVTASPLRDAAGSTTGLAILGREVSPRSAERERLQRELDDLVWLGRVRDALGEERMVLWAQPIVDLRTGERAREELLVRMRMPDGSIVAPGVFLPVAERYGLIQEIDRWVVVEAARLAATGREVEVNLSGPSVGSPELLPAIRSALDTAGADPSAIVFEVTETALVDNMETAANTVRRLTELGCRFALDDFGTGFASFTYLKHLPVDYLKIDVEFVRELADVANQHVVKAVVNLAHGFEKCSVAEGVEDEASLDLLRDFGVDYAQGYFIGRPTPV